MNQQYFRVRDSFHCIVVWWNIITALMWFSLNKLHEKYICFLHFPFTPFHEWNISYGRIQCDSGFFLLLAANAPTRDTRLGNDVVFSCVCQLFGYVKCVCRVFVLASVVRYEVKGYLCTREMNTVEIWLYDFRRKAKMLENFNGFVVFDSGETHQRVHLCWMFKNMRLCKMRWQWEEYTHLRSIINLWFHCVVRVVRLVGTSSYTGNNNLHCADS